MEELTATIVVVLYRMTREASASAYTASTEAA
jgi:hypothetical protein